MTGLSARSASWQGRRIAFVGVLAALLAAACVPVAPVEQLPPAASNYCVASAPTGPGGYQAIFDGLRTQWTDWAASDGSFPIDLQDGRILWLFGDTIVGRVRSNGAIADGWNMIRNSFVLQTPSGGGTCLTPIMGGWRGARTEAIPSPAPNEWYWPLTGVVDNGATPGTKRLRLFMYHMVHAQNPGGSFDFTLKSIDVATYSYSPGSALQQQSVSTLPLGIHPAYGETTLVGPDDPSDPNDPYIYAYGHTGTFLSSSDPSRQYVARVSINADPSIASNWAYYDGTLGTWSTPGAPASSAMQMAFLPGGTCPSGDAGTPLDSLTVVPSSATGQYLASAKPAGAFSTNVLTWSSPTPAGPWTCVGEAVTGLPNDLNHTFTYGGHVLTGLPGANPILVWSQNHNPLIPDVINNNQLYKAFYAVPAPSSLP